MGREIKFRAWDKVNKRMAQLEKLVWQDGKINSHYEMNVIRYSDGNAASCYAGSDITLMQYTGQKDVKGQEIYEGDVIEFTFRSLGAIHNYAGKLVFDQYMWLVETSNGDQFSLNRIADPYIIGNIHTQ